MLSRKPLAGIEEGLELQRPHDWDILSGHPPPPLAGGEIPKTLRDAVIRCAFEMLRKAMGDDVIRSLRPRPMWEIEEFDPRGDRL